jgi:hypothetical protein
MIVMTSSNKRSRFLLLPELGEPAAGAKQPVLRRYSLTRIPAKHAEPPAKHGKQAA